MTSKTSILSSIADHGTKSISTAYENCIQPNSVLRLSKGFKHLSFMDFVEAFHFILINWIKSNTIICLFNAPILLCALFPLPKRGRWIGILDWNEILSRSNQKIPLFAFYNALYKFALKRMDIVCSPSKDFIQLYQKQGIIIENCDYPLPPSPTYTSPRISSKPIKALFIGADYVRKGGDILLESWKIASFSEIAQLTFVTPHPPNEEIPGVTYLRNIKANTPEHMQLLLEHDIFILPTKNDAFGYALLEALSASMCVITTRNAGGADVVERFGGIVADTPHQAVKIFIDYIQNPSVINFHRNLCKSYIPKYRLSTITSLETIYAKSRTK